MSLLSPSVPISALLAANVKGMDKPKIPQNYKTSTHNTM